MNIPAPFSENQNAFFWRCFNSWLNVAEGGKRGGKNVLITLAYCAILEKHPSKIHLIAGVSTSTARLNILDCDGYGMRNFFEGIPQSLFESATLDGCSPMQTFIRIVLPMSKAALASIGLMYAVTYWNDYTHYKLYITDSKWYNFQMKLRSVIMGSDLPQSTGGATENTVKNAAIIVVIIPFMILYPFLQKYFVKGVNIGAVKE